jgi:hypothetical protein
MGLLAIEADLERILAWLRQWYIEDEYCPGLHVDHSGRRLAELYRAFTAQQLGSRLVDEANPDGMNPNLGAPPPDPEHKVRPGIYRGEVGQPDVLKHAEHAELALLIDQGVVRDDREVEVQGSGDSDRCDDVVLLDLVNDIHAFRHLAEDGMDLVEVGLRRMGDEELAATGVLAGMRHGECPRGVLVSVQVGLALDFVPRPPGADPRVPGLLGERIPTLNHEVRDDAVEPGSIIEFAIRQFLEIAHGSWYLRIE